MTTATTPWPSVSKSIPLVGLGIRVAPDLIFSNPAGARFGIADPAGAGAGAECS